VHVSAKDKATGKEQSIRIQASGGLSEADIKKMMRDAEEHAADDKLKRETVDSRNSAEGLINSTEKAMRDLGAKASQSDRVAVERAITDLREALKGTDTADIKTKTNALAQASMKIGEAMYRGAGAGGDASGGGAAGAGGGFGARAEAPEGRKGADGVVDADFEEVDDDKKKRA
jgi:molecular chaperone DnaK